MSGEPACHFFSLGRSPQLFHVVAEHHCCPQLSSMSWPRAGPVLNFVRSTKNDLSSSMPSLLTLMSLIQNFPSLSIVLNSELVTYIRLPSPVRCIMFG